MYTLTNKTALNSILVRPVCIFYFLIAHKNETEYGYVTFHFSPVGGRHIFLRTGPPH